MKPMFIDDRDGREGYILNCGVFMKHLTLMKQSPNTTKPLVVLESFSQFKAFAQCINEEYIQYIEPSPADSHTCLENMSFDKGITFFNIEKINRHLDKKEEFFCSIQPLLLKHQCKIHLCDAWQLPSTFIDWVTKEDSRITLIACSTRRLTDIQPHTNCEFFSLFHSTP